jgi:hypothetical protein
MGPPSRRQTRGGGGDCSPFFTRNRRAPSFAHKREAHAGSSFFIFFFSFVDRSPSLPHALLLASSSRVALALIGPHRVAFALSRRPRHVTSVASPPSRRPRHASPIATRCPRPHRVALATSPPSRRPVASPSSRVAPRHASSHCYAPPFVASPSSCRRRRVAPVTCRPPPRRVAQAARPSN